MPHTSYIHLQQAAAEVASNNSPTQTCLASFPWQDASLNWGHRGLKYVPVRSKKSMKQ